jgi:hypothetical protein
MRTRRTLIASKELWHAAREMDIFATVNVKNALTGIDIQYRARLSFTPSY